MRLFSNCTWLHLTYSLKINLIIINTNQSHFWGRTTVLAPNMTGSTVLAEVEAKDLNLSGSYHHHFHLPGQWTQQQQMNWPPLHQGWCNSPIPENQSSTIQKCFLCCLCLAAVFLFFLSFTTNNEFHLMTQVPCKPWISYKKAFTDSSYLLNTFKL